MKRKICKGLALVLSAPVWVPLVVVDVAAAKATAWLLKVQR